ncbi:MAG: DUF1579 family protein [Candidatus Wallbacteria bacterium]|nr:DUF1579 family protein [Candidatus Wallbacteria bacterium]
MRNDKVLWLVTVALAIVPATAALAQDEEAGRSLAPVLSPAVSGPPAPEMAQLDRWVGEWKATYTMPKSKAIPEGARGEGTMSVKKGIAGTFLVADSKSSAWVGASEDHSLTTFDRATRQWKGWTFGSADPANPIFSTGTVAGDTITMEASRGDVRLRETQTLANRDRIEGKVEVETGGEWHVMMTSTYMRVK